MMMKMGFDSIETLSIQHIKHESKPDQKRKTLEIENSCEPIMSLKQKYRKTTPRHNSTPRLNFASVSSKPRFKRPLKTPDNLQSEACQNKRHIITTCSSTPVSAAPVSQHASRPSLQPVQ
jgi:hypothetical protein